MDRNNRRILKTLARVFGCLAAIGASSTAAVAMTRVESVPTGFGRAGDAMGTAVAIYGDTALVGSPIAQPAPLLSSGVVQVFRHGDTGWPLESILLPTDPVAGEQFGAGLALGQDIAVVGTAQSGGSATYTFVRNGTQWTQTDKLTSGGQPSLSGDTLAINDGRVAHIYVRTNNTWVAQMDLQGDLSPDQGENVVSAVVSGDIAAISTFVPVSHNMIAVAEYFFARSNGIWTREAKIDLGTEFFSFSVPVVAISGQTALIGLGNVQAYVHNNGTWTLQGVLDPGSTWDLSIKPSISLDGDTAVVGVPGDDVLGVTDAGSAYVFTRSGDTWTRTARPYDPAGAYQYLFGTSVALSGTSLLVGSPGATIDDVASGKVMTFEYATDTWTPGVELGEGNAHADERFGSSVAASGTTMVVGAPNASSDVSFVTGVTYVFELADQGWVERAQLVPPSQSHNSFGYAVALDGSTLAVGSLGDNIGDPNEYSAVYVYSRNGDEWVQQARIGSGLAYGFFGSALGLVGDTLAIGDSGNPNYEPTGRVRVFARAQEAWSEQATIQPAESADNDLFGHVLAMSADTVIIGAPGTNVGPESNAGAAYVFQHAGADWQEQARFIAPMPLQGAQFGQSVALAGDTAIVGAGGMGSSSLPPGAAYVFTRNGEAWVLESTLLPPAAQATASFGTAVALSADATIAIVGDPLATSDAQPRGAAYVFSRNGSEWTLVRTLHGSQYQIPRSDLFGYAATFSDNTAFIGAPSELVGGGAYVVPLGDAVFANGFD